MSATDSKPLDLDQFQGFTPGPWDIRPDDMSGCASIGADAGGWRRQIAEATHGPWRSNAALIAAAPSLLAECRRQRDEIARLRAALTEALFAFGRAGGNHSGGPTPMREAWEAASAALRSAGGGA